MERVSRTEEILFLVGYQPLDGMVQFKYPGRVLAKSDNDRPSCFSKLAKSNNCWVCFGKILEREVVDLKNIWHVLPSGSSGHLSL